MNALEKIEKIYSSYLRDVERSREENGGLRGAFSHMVFGSRNQDSCHLRFAEDLEADLKEFKGTNEASREIVDYVLKKSAEYKDNLSVGMMFTAVHQYLIPLLEHETPEYLGQLAQWYDGEFPKRVRTPVMEQFRKRLSSGAAER